MGGKIITFDFSKYTIPRSGGYLTVIPEAVASYFRALRSHSADLYAFRLVPNGRGNRVEKLMSGSILGTDAQVDINSINDEHGSEMLDALTAFSRDNHRTASRNHKTILQADEGSNIALVAAPCDRGVIVGAWYNNQGDTDVSRQMLAFVLYCFAALNGSGPNPDRLLKERVYDTLPRDSRYGKFDANTAQTVLIEALQKRTSSGCSMPLRRKPQYRS